MKKYLIVAAAVWAANTAVMAQTDTLSLKDIVNGKYAPQYVYGLRPTNDGATYTSISNDGKQIVRRAYKTGKIVNILFDCNTTQGDLQLKSIDGYDISADESHLLIRTNTRPIYRRSYTATHYIYDVKTQRLTALSHQGAEQMPTFSPDGKWVAFVYKNNLYLKDLTRSEAEFAITKDGKFNEIINGLPDWVYEEEFTTNRSFDFSSDSRTLAWIRYDESKVPIYGIQEYKGLAPAKKEFDEYPGMYNYKYPVAGARNSSVSVLSYDILAQTTRTLSVPMDSDAYIPRIAFTSDPHKLAVVTLNRHQNKMSIFMVNPQTNEHKLAVTEENTRYIKETAYGSLNFYPGHFSFLSDRSGNNQAYLYTLDGELKRCLTDGKKEVAAFYGYNPKTQQTYYQAFSDGPLHTAVYMTNAKGKTVELSNQKGANSATFSKDFSYFINVHSSANTVPVTTLKDSKGKTVSTMIDNAKLQADLAGKVAKKEFFSFRTSEGIELNGWMIKPKDFDASKKYPVIMYQYSGPGSQEVTDSWGIGFMGGGLYENYLAQQGFIFVCVDGRGTGGRGADFEKCTYLHLGDLESKDQVETALYLGTLPYVNKDRIAIWGWSFGGFNTLMSMSEGRNVFRAGVAVAAPSNWKFYDTVYTERYMRTPQENAEGYNVSPIGRAKNLHGSLLLVHGTADDNVHFRNFTEMTEAYVQAGKQFEQQVYTNRNHGIYGGNTRLHLFTKITNFFNEKLK